MTVTRRQFTVGLALFVAAVAIVCATFGLTVKAHNKSVSPSCTGLTVRLDSYPADTRVTITVDVETKTGTFTGSTGGTWPWSPDNAHVWSVTVDSPDGDQYDFSENGTQQPCQTTTAPTSTSSPSTSSPPSTTSAPPSTSTTPSSSTTSSSTSTSQPVASSTPTSPPTSAPGSASSTPQPPATSAPSTTSSTPATSAPPSPAVRGSQAPATAAAGCGTGSTCEPAGTLPATGYDVHDLIWGAAVVLAGITILVIARRPRRGAA